MRKIFLFVTAALCSVTMAFAQDDTRTVISTCAFTGTPTAPVAGETWYIKWATTDGWFTPVTPNIYHVEQNLKLQKKNTDETWASVNEGTVITEGTYRFWLQVRIDTQWGAGSSYRLQNDGSLVVTVDGENWLPLGGVTTQSTYSYVFIFGPEMTVEKVTLPLKFTYNSSLDYKVNYINQAIDTKDLKNYTTGGTENYTYTKTTNKAPWFQVSSEGILSGTPTALSQQAVHDSVRLSDGEKDTIIALYVGPVAPLPANREVVSSASFTNFTTPKIGDINNESYRYAIINAIVRPEGAVYKLTDGGNTRMYKKVNDEFVQMADGEAFAEGTYKMGGQIRIDGNNGYFYVLDSENDLTATMDGKAMQISAGSTQDTYSYRFYSHEFTIGGEPEVPSAGAEIKFTAAAGADAIAANASFTVEGSEFSATITDPDNKMAIDANDCRFGDENSYSMYNFRLKTGGKSSATKNFITLNIPEAGTLRIAVRAGSNSATDRNLVIAQGGDTLYNQVIEESMKITITEGDAQVSVYQYVKVNVAAGSVVLSYPTNGLNFYGFALFNPADGYYLAGNFNGVAKWSVDDLSAAVKFVPNNTPEARPGEMVLKGVTLTAGDEFKIAQVKNGVIDDADWYGSGQGNNNFVVTDAFAGVKDIYFVPTWQDDWNGHIWVATHTPTAVENVAAEIKAVKRIVNGQLLIIRDGKIYNAQGARVQ